VQNVADLLALPSHSCRSSWISIRLAIAGRYVDMIVVSFDVYGQHSTASTRHRSRTCSFFPPLPESAL